MQRHDDPKRDVGIRIWASAALGRNQVVMTLVALRVDSKCPLK